MFLYESNLNNGAEHDNDALDEGPGLDVAGVALDEVEVPGFGPPRHTLELLHYLGKKEYQFC